MPDTPSNTRLTPQRWQRLQQLFERALPLDPDARSRLLLEECGDDPPLREQVLSLLLASSGTDQDFEAKYERAIAASLRGPEIPTGSIIGRYRVQKLLGRGGMGAVYLAERADEQFQQIVALKLVAPGILHPEAAGRFRSERQILARLNHPNIARLLDGGHTQDGAPYLVMEYVEGVRIDEFCNQQQLTIADRLRLIQQVCGAVQYAHQNLIVHRDLKPSNILVTREGVPKLLDFGIAKLLDPQSTDLALTRLRDRALTPAFASPEQIRGESVGTASDIFSLGRLSYELLAGTSPHPTAASLDKLEQLICQEPPPPSSRVLADDVAQEGRNVRVLSRELAGDLDNIVLKAMRVDPARRYASAAALAEDIQNYLDGRPVHARPDTLSYRVGKFVKRNTWAVASTSMLIMLIAGLTVFYTSRLAAERNRATREALKAEQVASLLAGIFRRANPWGTDGKQITATELLDRGAQDIERQLQNQPLVLSELQFHIGTSYNFMGDYARAATMLERSLALKARTGLADTAEYARTLYALANVRRFQARFPESEEHFRHALRIQRQLFPGNDLDTSRTLTHLGMLYYEMRRPDEALKLERESLAMTVALLGKRTEETTERLNNLGLALEGVGEYAQSERSFREAIALDAQFLPPLHPDILGTKSNLAALLNVMGHYSAAERLIREILPARRAVFGNRHPRVAFTLTAFGSVLTSLGKFDEADAALNEALGIFTEKMGAQHYRTADALRSLGHLEYARGNYARAEDYFRRAAAIEAQVYGAASGGIYRLQSLIAASLLRQGRQAEAEALLERSYEKLYAAGQPPSAVEDVTLELLARIRLQQNNIEAAAMLYQKALSRYEHFGLANHPDTAEALIGLARVAERRGFEQQAASFKQRALANLRAELPEDNWKLARVREQLDSNPRAGLAGSRAETARSSRSGMPRDSELLDAVTQPGLCEPQLAIECRG